MRYIQRQSAMARSIHWAHLIATFTLFVTGLLIYVPSIANGVAVDTLQVARLIHRGAAVVFIVAPLLGILVRPRSFAEMNRHYLSSWSPEEKEFMKKFIPYLFAPNKVHLPAQGRYKSGQIFADGLIIVFAVLIAISGGFLWAANSFSAEVIRWMYLLHDGSMIMLGIFLLAHIYLGLGIFKPYRGTARVMLGDGKISEVDARYHWGTWAEEELESGENVTEG